MTYFINEETNNYLGTPCGVLLERLRYFKTVYILSLEASPVSKDDIEKAKRNLINACQQLEEVGHCCKATRSIL